MVFARYIALAGLSLSAPLAAQTAAPGAPVYSLERMKTVEQALASDDFAGRAPATPSEAKVVALLTAQFKAVGLKPGNHGSWVQNVPTVSIEAQNRSPLTIGGGLKPLQFAFGTQMVAASFRAVPHTDFRNSPLVFVGYGINAPELGWNDYAGLDMHGKTAVILINDPDYAEATTQGLFKGRRMTYYGRWTYKFEEAARQGATAALIIHDTFPAAYGWNVVRSSWSGPQHYVASIGNGMDQTQANGWIDQDAAKAIFAAAGRDFVGLTAAAKQKGFRAVPLDLTASLSFDNAITRSNSRNVIGVLPGKSRPNEYVLYSAHWDHLGHCTPVKGDGICNGAVDNGTGVSVLIALAEAHAKAGRAARSLVFFSPTLEESGLLGSEYYAQHPVFPLAQTVGGVNMDALYPTGRTHDEMAYGGDKSELNAVFDRALTQMGMHQSPEDHPERGHYYRSDHFPLAKRGVPMLHLKRANDMMVGGVAAGEAADADYVQNHYHAPSDEYSSNWDWSGIRQDVELFYRIGRDLAMSNAWPNFHKGDEFRQVEDRSRAAK